MLSRRDVLLTVSALIDRDSDMINKYDAANIVLEMCRDEGGLPDDLHKLQCIVSRDGIIEYIDWLIDNGGK